MKIKVELLILFILINGLTFIVNGQPCNDLLNKIDIKNLKNQSYLKLAKQINCDSTNGTTIEDRICANLELQKQDSLLNIALSIRINECNTSGDTTLLKKLLLSQDLWERYRYAHCSSCVLDENRFDMITFLRCATNITIKRRDDLDKICDY